MPLSKADCVFLAIESLRHGLLPSLLCLSPVLNKSQSYFSRRLLIPFGPECLTEPHLSPAVRIHCLEGHQGWTDSTFAGWLEEGEGRERAERESVCACVREGGGIRAKWASSHPRFPLRVVHPQLADPSRGIGRDGPFCNRRTLLTIFTV